MRDADQHVERLARHAAALVAVRVAEPVIVVVIVVVVIVVVVIVVVVIFFVVVVIQSTVRRVAIAGTTRVLISVDVVVAVGIGVGLRFERQRLQPQYLVDLHRAVPIGIQSGYGFRRTGGGTER